MKKDKLVTTHARYMNTQRVHLQYHCGIGAQKPHMLWLLGPNYIMAVYLDPLRHPSRRARAQGLSEADREWIQRQGTRLTTLASGSPELWLQGAL